MAITLKNIIPKTINKELRLLLYDVLTKYNEMKRDYYLRLKPNKSYNEIKRDNFTGFIGQLITSVHIHNSSKPFEETVSNILADEYRFGDGGIDDPSQIMDTKSSLFRESNPQILEYRLAIPKDAFEKANPNIIYYFNVVYSKTLDKYIENTPDILLTNDEILVYLCGWTTKDDMYYKKGNTRDPREKYSKHYLTYVHDLHPYIPTAYIDGLGADISTDIHKLPKECKELTDRRKLELRIRDGI